MKATYDVIVVGSGAGGMVAALKAHDHGFSVLMIEKSFQYGDTSALSGGQVWIPLNPLMTTDDSYEQAATYLRTVSNGNINEDKLEAYLSTGPEMVRYLQNVGLKLEPVSYFPDYFSDAPGGVGGRSLLPTDIDGAILGKEFTSLREPPLEERLFNRYALDWNQMGILGLRLPGWKRTLAKILAKYWLDFRWRMRTRRDRRLTLGNALIAQLRKAMIDRDIPLLLNTRLVGLAGDNSHVSGAVLRRNGKEFTVQARHGVILAAGGFEHNQALGDLHMPVPTDVSWSTTSGENTGDTLTAAQTLGAAVDMLDGGWWFPLMKLPAGHLPNKTITHMLFRWPHTICVNHLGERFVDEAGNYNSFGQAIIADQLKNGVADPVHWMVFDATCRRKYAIGGLMPTAIMPDSRIPESWWDSHIYRAATISELARKIDVDPAKLEETVRKTNEFARNGRDTDFERGTAMYDRTIAGDPRIGANPCLAPIDRAPYYAVRIHLGDLGTKGGLKVDANARVVSNTNSPITGLYAIGSNAGSPFGGAYPGPGATLGPAMVFGYIAANHLSERAGTSHPRNAQNSDQELEMVRTMPPTGWQSSRHVGERVHE